MKNYFDKGNEMDNGKMEMGGFVSGKSRQTAGLAKPWAALIGVMLICASAYANAIVCEAEIEQAARSSALYAEAANKDRPGILPHRSVGEIRARIKKESKERLSDDSLNLTAADRCSQAQRALNHVEDELAIAVKAYEEPKPAQTSQRKVAEFEKRLSDNKLNLCMARAALAQCDSSTIYVRSTGNGGINRPSPQNPVATRTEASSPRQIADASPPSAAKGAGSSSTPGNLSPQQVASCSEEIKNKQIESQSWGGDANDVAARLGQFQKGLFEGRCAGHPEAQAYIAGANKMIGYKSEMSGGSPAVAQANSGNGNTTVGRQIQNDIGSTPSSGRGKVWVGIQNQCIKFTPEESKSDTQWFSYYNGCPITLKVCDNMSGRGWGGCGYEVKPGKTTKNWEKTSNVSRNGGNFVACATTVDGKSVFFDKEARNCYYNK